MIPNVLGSASPYSGSPKAASWVRSGTTFLSVSTIPKEAVTSDESSDNAPRPQQMQPDYARQDHRPDVPKRDLARHRQTEPAGMACRRSGVRIPLAARFFVYSFEQK